MPGAEVAPTSPTSLARGARPARRSSLNGSTKASVSDVVQPIFNRLQVAKTVVYDAETSGISWMKHFVCGHVLAFSPDPNDSFYLPVRHLAGGNLCDYRAPPGEEAWDGKLHPIEADLVKLLDRQDLTVIGHNLGFDLRFLWRLGFRLDARCIDTMVNATLIDELQSKFSLAFCTGVADITDKKLDITDYLIQQFPEVAKKPKDAMGQFWRLAGDDPRATDYARGDGTSTWQLNDYQLPELERQELQRVWDIECRLIPVLARMSITGIKIDQTQFVILRAEVKRMIAELEGQFPEGFSVRSPIDVKDWCEQHGHTDWPHTPPSLKFKDGQPSFKESWLETFSAGQQIVNVRKLITLRDSYLLPLMEKHIHRDDRVHTSFNQLRSDDYGYITGRLSSSEPNLQQASKHNEMIGRMHRSIFVPDDGMLWGTADFSQIEPRLLAHYSKCRVLVEGFNRDPPLDAHTAVAIACNRRWGEMTDGERKHYRNAIAKRINQTLLTGGGKGVLVKKYGMDSREVDQVWNDYFRAMPEIKVIQRQMDLEMRRRGYIKTLLGRRCRLADINRSYVALNRALQGGNADCIKTAMVNIDDYLASEGRPIDMLNSVHDALDFQFAEEHRGVFNNCLELMTAVGSQLGVTTVPFNVDVGEGRSWAEATFPGAKK